MHLLINFSSPTDLKKFGNFLFTALPLVSKQFLTQRRQLIIFVKCITNAQ